MFKDLKRTLRSMKAVKLRREFHSEPIYHDGFELMNEMLHPVYQILKIVKVKKLSRNVTLLRGVSDKPKGSKERTISAIIGNTLAPFRAGQYIGVKVDIDGVKTGRAYSIVSSPNNLSYYEIAVKDLGADGFVSPYLCNEVKVGDRLEVTEPLGNFYYNRLFHGKNLVFIAGGCGVTPFISMLRHFYENHAPYNVHLIYGCLTEKDILFGEEMKRMSEERDNFSLTIVLSEPESSWTGTTGFITKDVIKSAVGSLDDSMIYIVGPDLMREFLLDELESFNIPSNRIVWEIAPPISDITKSVGWPSDLSEEDRFECKVNWMHLGQRRSKKIKIKCTEPLLNSIERAQLDGVNVDNACRAGECALCRTRMVKGNVYVPEHVHIRDTDREQGYIHPCVSYPVDDLEIELFSKNR